jgi:hypothetical protein
VERIAEKILAHRFPLMGFEIETGPAIDWRRDYVNGISSGVDYFRRLPYLDYSAVGDHKNVWELNRHQHLVLLAQAWKLTGRPEFIREIETQLETWWQQNPLGYGINWCSALEVAFRALSWIWIFHIAGDGLSDKTRRRLLDSLYVHGRHIAGNLSVYFSPNTHLLGEAVAVHALGVLFPAFPGAKKWKRAGGDMVRAQMQAQVQADGSHFEHSTYYHVYALDMLMFSAAIEPMPADYLAKLAKMAEYLEALLGPQRRLPYFSDDDGGRMFHPYGSRERFGCGTLAAFSGASDSPDYPEFGAWWFGGRALGSIPPRGEGRYFQNSGLVAVENGDMHLVVDAGPFGYGRGGHSHSDTLSFVLRRGDEDLLVDAGTFTYVGSAQERNWFRGSAAHNTIRIDGLDQATPEGPFRWADKPEAEEFTWGKRGIFCLAATCRYRGFEHRRILDVQRSRVLVVDEVNGPAGEHLVEQFWHSGEPITKLTPHRYRIGTHAILTVSHDAELETGGENGWRSLAMGSKQPASVLRAAVRGPFPTWLTASIDLEANADPAEISALLEQICVELRRPLG